MERSHYPCLMLSIRAYRHSSRKLIFFPYVYFQDILGPNLVGGILACALCRRLGLALSFLHFFLLVLRRALLPPRLCSNCHRADRYDHHHRVSHGHFFTPAPSSFLLGPFA